MQTVLLTGITGYIAKHIAVYLLNTGYDVRGTLRDLGRAEEVTAALRPHLTDADNLDKRLSFVALDLTHDDGWDAAMDGVDVLMHTASPFPTVQPADENDLIRPAVDGALRAVKAAHAAGVTRVVMTSSTAAISGSPLPHGDTAYDETNWTDPDDPGITAYTKSKTLAERAVWDYVTNQAPEIALTMINPGFVVGAPLDRQFGTSVDLIKRVLRARDPMLPQFGFATVDVQDVAEMHVIVIDRAETHGQRIMTVDRFLWFKDIAQTLKTAFPKRRIVTRVAPNGIVRFLALFQPALRTITGGLGKFEKLDNSRAMATLGRGMRQTPKSVVTTAQYLIDQKLA